MMAGLFDDFKKHAEALHVDLKYLERIYIFPQGFYGTTDRSASANTIINNLIEDVKSKKENALRNIQEMERMINDSAQLVQEIDEISDVGEIYKFLEENGFDVCVEDERKDNIDNEIGDNECNANKKYNDLPNAIENEVNGAVVEYLKGSAEEDHTIDEISGNGRNDEEEMEQIDKAVQEYLEINNLDMDDIVTPYIPRKSTFSGKKS